MEQVVLEANLREKTGKSFCKKVRKAGYLPATVYGKNFEPLRIVIPTEQFMKNILKKGSNIFVELKIKDNSSYVVMPKETQFDALGNNLLHVDFHKISMEETITTTVPIKLTGEARGIKQGGILESHLWELEVECLPNLIPSEIVIDITSLGVDETIYVKDLKVPEEVEVLNSPEEIVVTVSYGKQSEETAEEGVAAAPVPSSREPELIRKKKEEE